MGGIGGLFRMGGLVAWVGWVDVGRMGRLMDMGR